VFLRAVLAREAAPEAGGGGGGEPGFASGWRLSALMHFRRWWRAKGSLALPKRVGGNFYFSFAAVFFLLHPPFSSFKIF